MKTVLAICAHPDDIEFLMAGTMIHLRNAGYELHYMTVANGSCGSNRYDTATLIRCAARRRWRRPPAWGRSFTTASATTWRSSTPCRSWPRSPPWSAKSHRKSS